LAKILEEEILAAVEKPSRYLGTELNSVSDADVDMDQVRVRIALAFPDLYDLGLGNLGLHILYAVLNQEEGVRAERVYAPAIDMERELRARGLPIFALESKDSLDQFDGIGITLQSELTFTNILNLIDLSGLSLRTENRREEDPLVFCGGPAVFNPEPLAPFIDFFVMGDGEDVVVEIARVLERFQGRDDRLRALAEMDGVYVPALYPMETLPDGRILPPIDGPKIVKRIARDLNKAIFPENYIVPYTRQVHDRVSLEVLRGCTQGCRFCQAGMTTRPVRERTVENIEGLLDKTLETTGYEEVSLVSLSTCDFSQVRKMVDTVVQKAASQRVGVSLPSLRLDSFSVDLADMVAGIRRSGLTFAPEAASPRLRAVINKWIPDEELLDMSDKAFGLGWDHVKLYFMIGLPTERDEDVEAIADLTLRTLEVGRQKNPKAKVNTGVSTFVPKPFTPFQWAAQIGMEETERRQRLLSERFRDERGVKFGRHAAAETFLEGLISRADRRGADLLEAAWRQGCRFDAWDEHLDLSKWMEAIEISGTDVEFELRERGLDERLPWDHIDIMIPKKWFQEDWDRATRLQHAPDCRASKCHRCGVIDVERPLCAHMLRNAIDGAKKEKSFVRPPPPPEMGQKPLRPGLPPVRPPEPPPVQRLVFRMGLKGKTRFLSHIEAMNARIRALRRASMPMSYSEGFHPHPKVAFAGARPVAEETEAEFMDVILNREIDPEEALRRLQETLPEGFEAYDVESVPLKAASLGARIEGAGYLFLIRDPVEGLSERVAELLASDSVIVERRRKKKRGKRGRFRRPQSPFKQVDLRPHIRRIEVKDTARMDRGADQMVHHILQIDLDVLDGRGARPSEIMTLLGLAPDRVHVVRQETRLKPVAAPSVSPMSESSDESIPASP
jgi:radical SAM family uncharacterized protein/radical SAM-linked protein